MIVLKRDVIWFVFPAKVSQFHSMHVHDYHGFRRNGSLYASYLDFSVNGLEPPSEIPLISLDLVSPSWT
jgi:hypothetical protein